MPSHEITLETKIADLLNNHPGMKEILIDINPKFKKLNNPVLRRTLGRIASVRQAAVVGAMDPKDLVDQLRKSVGQPPICEGCEIQTDACYIPESDGRPKWVDASKPAIMLDANQLLDDDKNPLAEVRIALNKLSENQSLILRADFQPEPLIETFREQGFLTHTEQNDDGKYDTYIKKN